MKYQVEYMYRNTTGKYVFTKANGKRIATAISRCEDLMIYIGEYKFLCDFAEHSENYFRVEVCCQQDTITQQYGADFYLEKANLVMADITRWAEQIVVCREKVNRNKPQ